jgi:hypothetical protein
MGCINGKSILSEEDIEFIARNTAMDQSAVEVRFYIYILRIFISVPDR